MFEFLFPDVGEGINEGKLIKWTVKEGDKVKEDQTLAEIETDKAVVEIPSPKTGTIAKLHHKEGDIVTVGNPLVTIDDGAGPAVSSSRASEKEAPAKQQASIGVKKIESRTSSEILAAPRVRRLAQEIGVDLAQVKGTGKDGTITEEDIRAFQQNPIVTASQSSNGSEDILASPSVRRLARELGVDLMSIQPTGPGGKVTEEDVQKSKAGGSAPISVGKNAEIIEMSGIRKAIARKMLESLEKAPQVTHCEEIDVTALVGIRQKEKDALKEKGIKLTYLPFVIKAVIQALQSHPKLNASVDGERIILKKYYNIGIATGTEAGLLVPNIKDADKKTILELANEISTLVEKARDKKLLPEEMRNGTFTITSIGSIGGQIFTPILNFPETGILGLGKIMDKPIVRKGRIEIGKMMFLCLSFDHRVIDGDEAAAFVKEIQDLLENPDLLMMES